jgi:hypothetical protein
MKKKNLQLMGAILFSLLLLTNCSKEQITLNRLAGDWTYSKIAVFGIQLDLVALNYKDATLHFDLCDDAAARCTASQSLNGMVSNFQYDITNKGATINLYNNNEIIHNYNIKSVNKNELIYSDTIASGIVAEFTLTR